MMFLTVKIYDLSSVVDCHIFGFDVTMNYTTSLDMFNAIHLDEMMKLKC